MATVDEGDALSRAGTGAAAGSAFGPWGAAIGGGLGLLSGLFGGGSSPGFVSFGDSQLFLPGALRAKNTRDILKSGVQQIGDLIRNPGGLSPTVADAIRARLAAESESISQNFRGIQAEQAGAAARTNLPVSIKTALESALNVAQERAQRGARQGALVESEALRREDLSQTFNLLNTILQFIQSGKGQAIQVAGLNAQTSAQRQATLLSFLGSLLSSGASPGK